MGQHHVIISPQEVHFTGIRRRSCGPRDLVVLRILLLLYPQSQCPTNAYSAYSAYGSYFIFHLLKYHRIVTLLVNQACEIWGSRSKCATSAYLKRYLLMHIAIYMRNTPTLLNRILYFDGLMQERRNSIAYALELRLSCTNLSILWCHLNSACTPALPFTCHKLRHEIGFTRDEF